MFNTKCIMQRTDDMDNEKWFHIKDLYFDETHEYMY